MKKDDRHEALYRRVDDEVNRVDNFVMNCVCVGPHRKYALQALREFQRLMREALKDDQRSRSYKDD